MGKYNKNQMIGIRMVDAHSRRFDGVSFPARRNFFNLNGGPIYGNALAQGRKVMRTMSAGERSNLRNHRF